jgi:hypothetical protein
MRQKRPLVGCTPSFLLRFKRKHFFHFREMDKIFSVKFRFSQFGFSRQEVINKDFKKNLLEKPGIFIEVLLLSYFNRRRFLGNENFSLKFLYP